MNPESDRMSNVDAMLEQLAQVAVPVDVQQQLDACCDKFCRTHPPARPTRLASKATGTRRWLIGASVAASLAVIVSFLPFGSRDAWAQVVRAMQAKPWVRFTVQVPDGVTTPEDFRASEQWLSSEHRVMAGKTGDRVNFVDLERQELHLYNPHTNTVTLSTSRDEQLVDFGSIETLRRLVSSEGTSTLSLPESPVEIVDRSHAEVEEEGRHWREFSFQCRNRKRSPSDYQVIIRVDPDSGLPVELRSTENFSPDQSGPEWRLAIDYPESGPLDIYAMGIPGNAAVIDRRSVETEIGEEINEFLAAYRAARGEPLRASSVKTVQEIAGRIVPEESMQVPGELMPDRVGYPSIMMGTTPVGNPDCKVTLDRRPLVGPEETILLHILIETPDGRNNDLFY